MLQQKMVRGYIFVILSAVIFGCNGLMVQFIYTEGVNSLSLVLLRNLLSLPVLGVLALRQHNTLRIPLQAVTSIGLISIMGCSMTPILLFSSYMFIASGTATVFHFIYPVTVVLAEVIFYHKRLKTGNFVSVLICAVGIFLFYNPGEPLDWRGSALALLSGITYTIYILLLANFRFPQVSGFLLSFHVSITSCMVMLPVCLCSGMLRLPGSFLGWVYCFGFSLIINVGVVVLFQQGTLLIGGQRASVLSTLEPITAVFVGMLAFQESVGFRTLTGCILVVMASILITSTDLKSSGNCKTDE